MSHPEATSSSGDKLQKFSDVGRAQKQHVRTLLFKHKDNLPAHIKHMFDTATDDERGKRAANNELIDNLFVKRNGKWEMNLSAPIFEQAKVRCYIYRRWNLNP